MTDTTAQWSGYSIFEQELLDGYFDGKADERDHPPEQSNRTEAYRHGWLNGRDDRVHRPRASAAELRRQCDMIEARFVQDTPTQ